MRKLGHGKDKNYPRIARIIEQSCDLVALQEVMEKKGEALGYDALAEALGPAWSGLRTDSPRPHTGDSQAEHYAVVMRTARVKPCAGWGALRYVPDDDGRGVSGQPDRFLREPAYGCFVAGAADFVLGTYHARWNKGNRDLIAAEVAGVEGAMAAMAQASPGEGDVWLVGDLNLVPKDLAKVVTRERRARGKGSTLDENARITDHLYDQLVVWDGRASGELGASAEVLDVRALGGDVESFVREVSDHLPIRVRVATERDDD